MASVKAIANQTISTIGDFTTKAKLTATETASQIVGSVSQATQTVKTTVTDSTQQVVTHLTETTDKAKASLNQSVQAAEQLKDATTSGVRQAISDSLQSWFAAHPVIGWLITHPLLSLGLLLVTLFVLRGLFRAIVRFSEQTWLFLLQSPFLLGQQILKLTGRLFRRLPTQSLLPQAPVQPSSERLTLLLSRLEQLNHEQDELLREVKTLLDQS